MQSSPKCQKGFNVQHVCANSKCINNPFMCSNSKCQCHILHQNQCVDVLKWYTLTNILKTHRANFLKNNQNLLECIENNFKQLKKLYQMYQQDFFYWRSQVGLNEAQKQIERCIIGNNYGDLNGAKFERFKKEFNNVVQINDGCNLKAQNEKILSMIKNIYDLRKKSYENIIKRGTNSTTEILDELRLNNICQESKIIKFEQQLDFLKLLEIQNKITKQIQVVQSKTERIQNNTITFQIFKNQIQKVNQYYQQQIKQIDHKYSLRQQQSYSRFNQIINQQSLFSCLIKKKHIHQLPPLQHTPKSYPSIISNIKPPINQTSIHIQYQTIIIKKKLKSIKLLFRASDHNFNIKQFWNICNQSANTLTLVQTEYGQIIGAYTPLKWNSNKSKSYEIDESGESFIFELSQKQKFKLRQKSPAIFHSIDDGPMFGNGPDFHIYNFANKNRNESSIGNSFYNQRFDSKLEELSNKYIGNKTDGKFKIIEWQVFELVYQNVSTTQVLNQ